ncbi:hypothetical protein BX667DRAFT_513926 [Coemansia mojavensis]|nr:hypothetical protein BX667DRAFT_513926 [Coemansia mojavensis]KAJ1740110.1 hypothetical protein LPJ68_004059 [Coemansia sp. RSA 1086]
MASNHERVETTIVWTDGPADSVAIRGTFSDSSTQWWQETIPLHPFQDSFSATLWLKPGQYAFKFIINKSEWNTSSTYATADDGHGNINNIVDVLLPSKAHLNIVVDGKARQASETTLSSNNGANSQKNMPSENSRLLDVSGGKISGYVAESQLQPDARPRRDEEAGNALQPSFQLRKFLIWAMVVLLFVLLGIASALMDSV